MGPEAKNTVKTQNKPKAKKDDVATKKKPGFSLPSLQKKPEAKNTVKTQNKPKAKKDDAATKKKPAFSLPSVQKKPEAKKAVAKVALKMPLTKNTPVAKVALKKSAPKNKYVVKYVATKKPNGGFSVKMAPESGKVPSFFQ